MFLSIGLKTGGERVSDKRHEAEHWKSNAEPYPNGINPHKQRMNNQEQAPERVWIPKGSKKFIDANEKLAKELKDGKNTIGM